MYLVVKTVILLFYFKECPCISEIGKEMSIYRNSLQI